MGEPQITFTSPIANPERLRRLRGSVFQALIDCTPLRLTPELGKALAGRMMLVRLQQNSKEREASMRRDPAPRIAPGHPIRRS